MRLRYRIACIALPFVLICGWNAAADEFDPKWIGEVESVPDRLRSEWNLSEFYQKHISVRGFSILGSEKVSDNALRESAWIVARMVGHRPDVLDAMTSQKVRLAVMAYNEYTTDIPEHSHLKSSVYWDRRARGLGATPDVPVVSCAEENVLCYRNDPYSTENILIHEFAHAIHETGMNKVDATFDQRLENAYQAAKEEGLWRGTYAESNRQEYFAEGVQCWFDDNRENDALHNHVDTRTELVAHDPRLAKLVEEVIGDISWKYNKPLERTQQDRQHLQDYDAVNTPRFQWRDEPIPTNPEVLIQTELGDIEVRLNAKAAPKTVANFLRYVHEGFYSDGVFFRTVRSDNQPDNPIKISVLQARANPKKEAELFPSIPLERTSDTGLRHKRGTISMAREEPDSGQDHFFVCLQVQPELDFGGKRNPDGQGFASFGEVTKGIEILEKIQQLPAKEQTLETPIRIQRAIRLN
jgi:cyclophilin family peptidyl-prolyl cis-trans isomerase